jgi:hypothetical protein
MHKSNRIIIPKTEINDTSCQIRAVQRSANSSIIQTVPAVNAPTKPVNPRRSDESQPFLTKSLQTVSEEEDQNLD